MNAALLHCIFAMALDAFLLSNFRANEKGTELKGVGVDFGMGRGKFLSRTAEICRGRHFSDKFSGGSAHGPRYGPIFHQVAIH